MGTVGRFMIRVSFSVRVLLLITIGADMDGPTCTPTVSSDDSIYPHPYK